MQAQAAAATQKRDATLLDVCEQLVALARKAGASESEAYAERTRESSVKVREGNVEELQQATSKGVGLRVITAGRLGFAYGTDFSKEGLRTLAARAVSLAKSSANLACAIIPLSCSSRAANAGRCNGSAISRSER